MRELVADRDRATTPMLGGWGALWSAIALNVSQVFLLDSTEGLREPALIPVAAAGFLAELWLFGRALRCLSPVIAYAVYGTTPAVVTILSIAFFGEPLTLPKLVGVVVVTAGVILLATEGIPVATGRLRRGHHTATGERRRRLRHVTVVTEPDTRTQRRTPLARHRIGSPEAIGEVPMNPVHAFRVARRR
jgi:multidrug transporter EmrE-like cation transporter